jgi:hypothetical protein
MAFRTRLIVAAGSSPNDFDFPINPETVDRDRGATYADVPVALADFSPSSGATPIQWVRNNAEQIAVDFALYVGGEFDSIEADLAKLDRLMEIDPRTGEPPDLLLIHGQRRDRVRLVSKSVKDMKKYNRYGAQQWARVSLSLKVLRPRQ